jgi:hypothetical protein
MLKLGILNHYPLGICAAGLIVVLLVSVEAGYRLGLRKRQKEQQEGKTVSKDFVLGSMFALLGLVMAFTYAFTVSRADMRQHAHIGLKLCQWKLSMPAFFRQFLIYRVNWCETGLLSCSNTVLPFWLLTIFPGTDSAVLEGLR